MPDNNNMNFGVDLLPVTTGTYSLGSNSLRWILHADSIYIGDSNTPLVGFVTGVKGNSESTYRTGQVNLTAANLGAATSDHSHGNLTNSGCITTAITIASNDYLIIGDTSASGKIGKGPVFNTSNTTKCLTQAGTWADFAATDSIVEVIRL